MEQEFNQDFDELNGNEFEEPSNLMLNKKIDNQYQQPVQVKQEKQENQNASLKFSSIRKIYQYEQEIIQNDEQQMQIEGQEHQINEKFVAKQLDNESKAQSQNMVNSTTLSTIQEAQRVLLLEKYQYLQDQFQQLQNIYSNVQTKQQITSYHINSQIYQLTYEPQTDQQQRDFENRKNQNLIQIYLLKQNGVLNGLQMLDDAQAKIGKVINQKLEILNQIQNLKQNFCLIQPYQLTQRFLDQFNFKLDQNQKRRYEKYQFFINLASKQIIKDNKDLEIKFANLFLPIQQVDNKLELDTSAIEKLKPNLLHKNLIVKLIQVTQDDGLQLKSIYFNDEFNHEEINDKKTNLIKKIKAYKQKIFEEIMFKQLKLYVDDTLPRDRNNIMFINNTSQGLIKIIIDKYFYITIEHRIPTQDEIQANSNPQYENYCQFIDVYQRLTSQFLCCQNQSVFYHYALEIKTILTKQFLKDISKDKLQIELQIQQDSSIKKIFLVTIQISQSQIKQQVSKHQAQFLVTLTPFSLEMKINEYFPRIPFENCLQDLLLFERALKYPIDFDLQYKNISYQRYENLQ